MKRIQVILAVLGLICIRKPEIICLKYSLYRLYLKYTNDVRPPLLKKLSGFGRFGKVAKIAWRRLWSAGFEGALTLGFPFFPAFEFPGKRKIFIKFPGIPTTQRDSGKSGSFQENSRDLGKNPENTIFFYFDIL